MKKRPVTCSSKHTPTPKKNQPSHPILSTHTHIYTLTHTQRDTDTNTHRKRTYISCESILFRTIRNATIGSPE